MLGNKLLVRLLLLLLVTLWCELLLWVNHLRIEHLLLWSLELVLHLILLLVEGLIWLLLIYLLLLVVHLLLLLLPLHLLLLCIEIHILLLLLLNLLVLLLLILISAEGWEVLLADVGVVLIIHENTFSTGKNLVAYEFKPNCVM